MKLILAGVLCLTAALAFDAYRSRRLLTVVATKCIDALEACAKPICAPIGWHP